MLTKVREELYKNFVDIIKGNKNYGKMCKAIKWKVFKIYVLFDINGTFTLTPICQSVTIC